MTSNVIQIGDRVRYDRNDKSKEGTVRTALGDGHFGVRYDSDEPDTELNSHHATSLFIILTHGVSRNKDEHDLVMSGLNEAMERLRALGPQIDRAIAASSVGRVHELMTAFGFTLPKVIRDVLSTALFASGFVDLIKDSSKIDPKSRAALTILIEAVRLLGRALNVK